jgi:predicted small secreted protein
MKKLVVVLIAALAATFATAGCNTIAGMGKDLEAAGGAVEKSASDTKKKM